MMKKIKHLNISLIGGHIVECFDNTLYGFFAVMLAPLFFPSSSEHAGNLASYGAFAAGFLARPLGAAFFGLIGDKIGRKMPLMLTMVFVGIPTLIIGIIPTYETWGLFAPAVLVLCRLTQGFFWGGEFTGVNLYISENFENRVLGAKTGMLIASGGLGAILATSVGALFSIQMMPDWCWRIPFILGGVSAFWVYYLRQNLQETVDFEKVQSTSQLLTSPWLVIMAQYKSRFILACLIAGLSIMPLYSTTILGNELFKKLGYTTSESLMLNMFNLILGAILIVYYGRLADMIGFRRQMLLGTTATAIVVFPAYALIAVEHVTTWHVYAFIVLLTVFGSIINGCAMPYIAKFFPTNCRYTAVAISVTLGEAMLGGTMPLVGASLSSIFNSTFAPSFWLFFVAIITAVGICIIGYENNSKNSSGRKYFMKMTKAGQV